jgi:hypothetical protein
VRWRADAVQEPDQYVVENTDLGRAQLFGAGSQKFGQTLQRADAPVG